MTLRRQKPNFTLLLEQGVIHTYIGVEPEPANLCDVEVWIRRADGAALPYECTQPTPCCGQKRTRCDTGGCGCGHKNSRWLLRYPAYDYVDGRVGFRWDCNLHNLPPGRYRAEVRFCGCVCAQFEIVSPHCYEVAGGGNVETLLYEGDCGPADGARSDVDPVFIGWYNYKTETTAALEPLDVLLEVDYSIKEEHWDDRPLPELVVSDGVITEHMKVLFVSGTIIGVGRTEQNRFLPGACVRFLWTDANLEAAGYDNPNFIGYDDLFDCGTTEDV